MTRKSKRELERAVDDLQSAGGDTIDSQAEAYAALVAAACGHSSHRPAELECAFERWPSVAEVPSQ
ncbi:hypothetical protein RBH20_09735 [Haloarcula sp. H-GB4]|uniref:hypothetical protein n=1 Tax=Haloarcula sp. H-GB4 TaxID=3069755 RepID=UPI0027B6D9CC|nr:hypothetical protein [Haloarcula sp. H-GB4]MDQ2072814.1 hypothetical protein [Haloarcula sp. H-GB4]